LALSLKVESSGESTGVCFVNLLSKLDVSSSFFFSMLSGIGGVILLFNTSSQLTFLKKEWFLMAVAPSTVPNLAETCLFNSFLIKSLESWVRYGGRNSLPLRIFSIVFLRLSPWKGGWNFECGLTVI
jgi:hypothetical protein